MEVQFGPNAHDEPNLLYKLQRKIKVFDTSDPLPNRGYNLVASASKYGAVFIGTPDGKLAVYHLKDLVDKECEPNHLPVQLQEKPTHIAVNSDHELLAVTGGRLFVLFKVVDLLNQNVSPSMAVQFDVSPSTFVSDVKWNPCIPDTIAYAFYDGSIVICQAGQGQVKKLQSSARCLCWSPKGKQLVVGNNDGTICQYKPDLSLMKSFPAPNLFQNCPVEVLAIYWISTFQFAVVYKNATDNSKPAVAIVNTPKGGQPSCLNYEDVCYSMGSSRPWYYYLQGLAQWNVILCSSSNSMEIATLGTTDGASWLQWCQSDEARPELPLTDKKQENYPIGVTIDTAAIHQLPWGENEKLPFMPTLHVLSQTGLLTVFNVINLNKEAPQICSPVTVVSTTPFPAQAQPVPAPPAIAVPLPKPAPAQPAAAPFAVSAAPAFAPVPSQPQPLPQTVVQPPKPVEVQAPPAPVQVQPKAPIQKDPTPEINAALKAEQELANKQKADSEFRNMLVREANEFQAELYEFVTNTRKAQIQFYRDLHAIDTNPDLQNLDAATLKKDCSVEDLRSAIIALKLDLVRACAVVAEARTQSDAKDLDQWTQADPLTTKRVASVKKLAYYVQNQLEQAHSSLNYKWNKLAEEEIKSNKKGPRMIRPIMDDVYQPLVKQQEILSRQEAVLKMLKNTLNECDGPVYKSTPILRSTPFKKDPLSKLTKNILNMSLEPQKSESKNLLTPQKLDALRDMLSNHKTVKIKPVNVEMRHHLTTMRISYEKSLREEKARQVKIEPTPVKMQVKQEVKPVIKQEPKPMKEPPKPVFAPIAVTPASATNKSWFTEVPKKEPPSPATQPQEISFTITNTPNASRSVLKNLLENKQVTVEVKKDENTMDSFMGQKICSPSNFNFSSVIVASPTASSFTTKPISALNNMLNQFAPAENKTIETEPPKEKMSNLFTISKANVPDVLGSSNMVTIKRVEPKAEKSKENTPEKTENVILNIPKVKDDKKENEKPFGVQSTNKSVFGSVAQPVAVTALTSKTGDSQKPDEVKPKLETKTPKDVQKSTAAPASSASIFATANATITVPKPKSALGSPTTTSATSSFQSISKPDSTSIFASANTTPKTQSSSIFGASSTPSSVFGAKPSIFGTAATATSSESAVKPTESTTASTFGTAKSVFGSAFTATIASVTVPSTKTSETSTPTSTPSSPESVSTPVTTSSIFGAVTSTTKPSVFGGVSAFSSSTPSSVFGSGSAKSAFGTSSVSTTTGSTTTTSAPSTSVFGTTTPVSAIGTQAQSTATSVFGTATTTKAADAVTTSASIFENTATTSASVFGSATTTSTSVFGSTTTAAIPSSASVFGNTTTTTTPSSVFGSTATTPASVFASTATTAASVFGSATTTTPASVFGSTTTTPASVFGNTTTTPASVFESTATTPSSVFGSTTTTSASFGSPATSTSVFGSTATTPSSVFGTAAKSAFGSPATTSAPSSTPSVFSGATQNQSVFGTPSTQASVFGSPTTQTSVFGSPATFGNTATTQSAFGTTQSVFGSPQTTQASVFGSTFGSSNQSVFGSPTSPVFGAQTQASVFGTPTQTTQSSVFGTPTQTTQASVFGTPTQTTQASVFGTPTTQSFGGQSVFGSPATTTQSSMFGGESLFASVNISTTTPSSGGSIFGGSTASPGFGSSNTNVFGGKTTFGQPNPAAEAIFGGGGGGFGQTQQSNSFWGSNNNSSGGFGSSGFGQQATTQSSSVFGTGSFSAPSPPGQAFGSPTSSTGGFGSGFGSKAVFGQPAGFGSPTSSGFGAPAAFGGFSKSPGGFGSSPSFGSAPAFGGSAFGGSSPGGSVFGSAAPATGFGSPTQSNATFESLATQNTLTFGNLAQQSAPAQPAPSFNTSPSFTGWRG
ncbi:nuclear pore complex protein Nup214-like isoform X1 [Leguminivora glycinivorella]|uniref:nuclear pore complex protein Nup214-like isoform X1 n=1 Tax=Leguminivora glycinivorella TaxID=1035111 RepID=UPI00200E8DAF|nr:nuclear pore complex protein Nup214-like isoform X1 [Leguminivora glycinivorella]